MDRIIRLLTESRAGRALSAIGNLQIAAFGIFTVAAAILTMVTPLVEAPAMLQLILIGGIGLAGGATVGLVSKRIGLDDPRDEEISRLRSELRSKHIGEALERLDHMVLEGKGIRSDYETAKYPHADSEEKEGAGWARVDAWEREVIRALKDESDVRVFMQTVDLSPVMDRPWNLRIVHHMDIRVGRLQDVYRRRENTWDWDP